MALIFASFFILALLSMACYRLPVMGAFASFFASFVLCICASVFFVSELFIRHEFILFGNFLFSPHFIASPLENLFCLLVSFVGMGVSFFAIGYIRRYENTANLAVFASLYNFFILSMYLCITSDNVFSFVLLWEVMSLLSVFLILVNDKKPSLKIIMNYLGVAQVGAFCMTVALVLMGVFSGGFRFEDFHDFSSSNIMSGLIFVLLLAGFGSKAGIFPFQYWLQDTYAKAPAIVSALMSAVMVKIGIFAFLKFSLFLPLNLELIVFMLVICALSVLIGALNASVQKKLKPCIAYSTSENAGIIFLGIAAGLYGKLIDNETLMNLGFVAALFHMLNHGVFKSLLFLGAGYIQKQSDEDRLDFLGGIIKNAPVLSYGVFVGILALSAIPPLNGFASEWLTYKALFMGGFELGFISRIGFVVAIFFLALGGVVALFAFVRFYGVVFLGLPRSKQSQKVKDGNIFMSFAIVFFATLCIVFALNFDSIFKILNHIVKSINHSGMHEIYLINFPLLVLLLMICAFIGFAGLILFRANFAKPRLSKPWACGFKYKSDMQMNASPFSGDIKSILSFFYKPEKHIKNDLGYFEKISYESLTPNHSSLLVDKILLKIQAFAKALQIMQNGLAGAYVAYILVFLSGMFIYVYYFL